MARPLQHRQAAQFPRLPPARARKLLAGRPKADHALTISPDHSKGALHAGLIDIFRHPVSRRKWLTIASGLFISVALVAWYGFGLAAPWAPLMTIAAVFAGYDIALRAWSSLRLRQLSIELLVIVAAIGALFINNHWESAAVTFLFMLGAWLESRTMSRTRGALKALIDAAPVTATVLRWRDNRGGRA